MFMNRPIMTCIIGGGAMLGIFAALVSVALMIQYGIVVLIGAFSG